MGLRVGEVHAGDTGLASVFPSCAGEGSVQRPGWSPSSTHTLMFCSSPGKVKVGFRPRGSQETAWVTG